MRRSRFGALTFSCFLSVCWRACAEGGVKAERGAGMLLYDWSVPRCVVAMVYPCEVVHRHAIEHGPCQVNPDGETTVLNPFSWNNLSNGTSLIL